MVHLLGLLILFIGPIYTTASWVKSLRTAFSLGKVDGTASDASLQIVNTSHSLQPVLILDIDGTLYDDECLIEQQIRDKCHELGRQRFNLTSSEAQALYRKFGTTLKGLLSLNSSSPEAANQLRKEYYAVSYADLDMSRLLKYTAKSVDGTHLLTGYSHTTRMQQALHEAQRTLLAIDHSYPIVIASNSPSSHVRRVLHELHLSRLNVSLFLTPDHIHSNFTLTKDDPSFWIPFFEMFPRDRYVGTLFDDRIRNLLVAAPLGIRTVLVNNSEPSAGLFEGLAAYLSDPLSLTQSALNNPSALKASLSVADADYLQAKNVIDEISMNLSVSHSLQEALQDRVHRQLVVLDLGAGLCNMLSHILRNVLPTEQRSLHYIAMEANEALAAGILDTLRSLGLRSVVSYHDIMSRSPRTTIIAEEVFGDRHVRVDILLGVDFMSDAARDLLRSTLGSSQQTGVTKKVDLVVGAGLADLFNPPSTFAERVKALLDVQSTANDFENQQPTHRLPQFVYLPITFSGETRLLPPASKSDALGNHDISLGNIAERAVVPAYHAALQHHGHNLDTAQLLKSFADVGADIVAQGRAPWRVYQRRHRVMWRALCGFLQRGLVTAASLSLPHQKATVEDLWNRALWSSLLTSNETIDKTGDGTDAVDGIESPEGEGWRWVAENEDFLLRFPAPEYIPDLNCTQESVVDALNAVPLMNATPPEEGFDSMALPRSRSEGANRPQQRPGKSLWRRTSILFTGPRQLMLRSTSLPASRSSDLDDAHGSSSLLDLAPNEVLLETSCSMVSAGTELKVYRGDLLAEDADEDEPLDTTLRSLTDQDGDESIHTQTKKKSAFDYPLEYGYSLVGRIAALGAAVDREVVKVGDRVFAFVPHATASVLTMEGLQTGAWQLIPCKDTHHLSDEDAVFLPSVETALALVQSAGCIPGDRVLVVGQGLIGTLTAATLQHCHGGGLDVLCVADVSDVRLDSSARYLQSLCSSAATNSSVQYWNPQRNSSSVSFKGGFDVVIEVSGRKAGLALALKHVRYGGKVILGSWYSPADTSSTLPLGAAFHRRNVQVETVQVSRIPGRLVDRYDKTRRFQVAWRLLQHLRPSRLFETSSSNIMQCKSYQMDDIEEVREAYQKVDAAEAITVLLRSVGTVERTEEGHPHLSH